MVTSNHERIGRALNGPFVKGMAPYVQRELEGNYGKDWQSHVIDPMSRDPALQKPTFNDPLTLIAVVQASWDSVFKRKLGQSYRNLLNLVRETRHDWAHNKKAWSTDDADMALGYILQVLQAIGAAEEAAAVQKERAEVVQTRTQEQTKREVQKVAQVPTQGQPQAGLKAWRELVTPHRDVQRGTLKNAELALDLAQVHRGEAMQEVQDPAEFFKRTFMTQGLKDLLVNVLKRVSSNEGDPVIKLHTNFGGGKTHSMLALYHLFGSNNPHELVGIDVILAESKIGAIPKAKRAVIVGTAFTPGKVYARGGGVEIRTLWGEMAFQLGGAVGYKLIEHADINGTSPGTDDLVKLFRSVGPSVIFIDEWVAFVRNTEGKNLACGSFDTNLTFAQSLTEAVKSAPKTVLVASLPQSRIEVGGDAGQQALAVLENIFRRIEATWRPADKEETYEIVRRRLFEPLAPENTAQRDAVLKAFKAAYDKTPAEFPPDSKDWDLEKRMRACYPFHPELFECLDKRWGTIDGFQRTRGVLRILARVIQTLWERSDGNLLIMSGTVPLDAVSSDFNQYLEGRHAWQSVVDAEVDGLGSLAFSLDDQNKGTLGKTSAARRVARTLYLHTAPMGESAQRGVDLQTLKLGCVQPGETAAVFSDALRRLSEAATHLHVDGSRYWFDTHGTLLKDVRNLASSYEADDVLHEIEQQLETEAKTRGEMFVRVHPCPKTSADVPDDGDARLVIVPPDFPYSAKGEVNPALDWAKETLEKRGSAARRYKNSLVFVAADSSKYGALDQAARTYMAWRKVHEERVQRELRPFEMKQTESQLDGAQKALRGQLQEVYQWFVRTVPDREKKSFEWKADRISGSEPLVQRVSRKAREWEDVVGKLGPSVLRQQYLDAIPLWRDDHVRVRQLIEDFGQYLYLPRLRNAEVLVASIREGTGSLMWQEDTFAYAAGYDDKKKRYHGLVAGHPADVDADGPALVVKPDVAARQLASETSAPLLTTGPGNAGAGVGTPQQPLKPTDPVLNRTYAASVELDPDLMVRDLDRIRQDVIEHLKAVPGAEVKLQLHIEATAPDGFPDTVQRNVLENSRTRKLKAPEFRP
jgi:hypothetical protein